MTTTTTVPSPPAASRAVRGTLVALLLRVVSFVCTQATFRLVPVSVLGQAHVELELVATSILFFSREGFRLVLSQRYDAAVAQYTVLVHTVMAFLCATYYTVLWTGTDDDATNDDTAAAILWSLYPYQQAAVLYCLAAWMEGWAEPRILYCLSTLQTTVKASAEGIGTIAKTMGGVVLLTTVAGPRVSPVTCFGLAQVLYAIVYNVVVVLMTRTQTNAIRNTTTMTTTTEGDGQEATTTTTTTTSPYSLILTFTLQGLLKHALTEGDRFVLRAISANYDQGLYVIGSSYGGMAARLLLQPLEENARLLWTIQSNNSPQESQSLTRSFTSLLRFVLCIGLLFATIAVHYTHVLMVLLGQTTKAAPVVSAFCVLTACLALNGTAEAFVYGVVARNAQQVAQLSMAQTMVGLLYFGMAPYCVQYYHGTVGLVLANTVCTGLRAVWALYMASRYMQMSIWQLLSSIVSSSLSSSSQQQYTGSGIVLWLAFGVAYMATRWSEMRYNDTFHTMDVDTMERSREWWTAASRHVGVGVASVAGIVATLVLLERVYLTQLRDLFGNKSHKAKQE